MAASNSPPAETAARYSSLGVSAGKEEVLQAASQIDEGILPGAFCRIAEDPHDPSRACVLHSDGAGSKSLVAWLAWKELGDVSLFRGLAQDAAVMNLDDMACVGATDGFLLSNTIGRNARWADGAVLRELIAGYADFVRLMTSLGVRIVNCGGETADVPDLVRTLVVDCSAFASLPKAQLIGFEAAAGDAIVGLAAGGKAAWERSENSGIGSNGMTLARHALLSADCWRDFPAARPISDTEPAGRFRLGDELPGCNMTLAQALLSPTRPHVSLIGKLQQAGVKLHGLIHCTGGGQTKCLHFGAKLHYIKHSPFEPPPLFRLIADEAQVSWQEMYSVFNMGHRMEIYCPPDEVAKIVELAAQVGIDARQIGDVEASAADDNRLTITSPEGELRYGH